MAIYRMTSGRYRVLSLSGTTTVTELCWLTVVASDASPLVSTARQTAGSLDYDKRPGAMAPGANPFSVPVIAEIGFHSLFPLTGLLSGAAVDKWLFDGCSNQRCRTARTIRQVDNIRLFFRNRHKQGCKS